MTDDKTSFFKEEVFIILAKELWQRYYQNEKFGKSFGLKIFEDNDIDTESLRMLMGISPINWAKKNRLSLSIFESALKDSAFSWSISDFVVSVTKQPLLLKTDVEAREHREFQSFLQSVAVIDPIFLSKLSNKQLHYWFDNEKDNLVIFQQVSIALKNLPTEYMRMPLFSYKQTGNAHSFDEGTASGTLLLQLLDALSEKVNSGILLARTEVKHQLLAEFNLLKDDIANDVAVRGLVSKKDGQINQMWKQASLEGCSWNVPLKEILLQDEIYPFVGNNVLVVENSGVYSILVDLLPTIPIVCSSGQFTYAVWQLLRKLTNSNTQIYYVGDLDPEGLAMAQRLIDMFHGNARTISMKMDNYCLASKPSDVSQVRLKQLRVIKEPLLRDIADSIIETGKIAYQEGFIQELIQEVCEEFDIGKINLQNE